MKGDKTKVFWSRSDYMEANKQRVEKRSIIAICKYPVYIYIIYICVCVCVCVCACVRRCVCVCVCVWVFTNWSLFSFVLFLPPYNRGLLVLFVRHMYKLYESRPCRKMWLSIGSEIRFLRDLYRFYNENISGSVDRLQDTKKNETFPASEGHTCQEIQYI